MMTHEEKKNLYVQLSAPFPESAIQRTEGRITGRGYDTSGIGYQFVVNRLNEVLGLGGWRTEQKISVRETTTSKGRIAFDSTCELTLQFGEWLDGKFVPWAESHATGGHTSMLEADAKKGSYTNALKKGAAMLGCGKQAYEGTLDDDNLPMEEEVQHVPIQRPPSPQKATEQKSQIVQRPAEAPAPKPAEQVPQNVQRVPEGEQQNHQSQPQQTRNRLTSKQLSAIWSLARKLNYDQQGFRREVKARYGVQPEFLSKEAASNIIQGLSARAANGSSHPAGEQVGS